MTRLRAWSVGLLAGMLLANVVVALFDLLWPQQAPAWLGSAAIHTWPALACLLLILVLRLGPVTWREFTYWGAKPFLPADAFLLAAFVALVSAPLWTARLWGNSPRPWVFLTTVLGVCAGGAELARWARRAWDNRSWLPENTTEGVLLDRVLGADGMEPLLDLDVEDALDRLPFVDTLEAAVRHPRSRSVTFGLDGPWGAGKTTILNALEKRLLKHDALVVRFDAWNFREPARVVGNYLEQLGKAFRQAGGVTGVRAQLRRLGLGIAPLAGARLGDAIRSWLSSGEPDSVRTLVNELRTALHAQRRLVVVIVDDLDRLEHDELHAALRTLRLVADLPRVAHVLAYDRRQIARVLFPQDTSGQVARDYLGKIVQIELSLSTPTPEASTRILGQTLQPLFDIVSQLDADSFINRLNSLPRQVFIEAMPTPREIRRVAAATALLWPRLQRDVNLFDLFVLQVIHARFPRLYGALHAHPEWFTEQRWSGDLWRMTEGVRWKEEGKAFVKRLWESQESDDVNAARLLTLIFPSSQQGPGRLPPSEPEARRERRICHPDVFPRYFQLSVPREKVAESSVEELAGRVLASQAELRAALMQQTVEEAARDNRVRALFEQWDIFLAKLGATDVPLPFEVARDVAIGIAHASSVIAGDYNNPLSARRMVATPILEIANRTGANPQITRLLCDVIRECTSFAVSGSVVFYSTTPDLTRRPFPNWALDERAIHGEFDRQVQIRFTTSPSTLFALPDDDLGEVLYRTQQELLVRDVFTRALQEHPEELPRLLGFAVKLGVNSPDLNDVSVFDDGLASLHQQLDLETIHRLTEHLPTDYWKDLHQRALVHYFRQQHSQVVARAKKDRTVGESAPPPAAKE